MTPDLEIRVITESETRLAYVLRYAKGKGKRFDRRIEGPTLHVPPRQYQFRVLKRLELLGDQLGTHDQRLSLEEVEKELAAIGHDLYKELFSRELRVEYSQFRKQVRSLLIVSDEPWIPWEIVKPYATEGDDRFDDDFLCVEFELTRWLAKGGPLLLEIAASRIAAVEAVAPESSRRLRHTSEEVEFLRKVAERHEGVAFQALRDSTHQEIMELLEKGGNGVLLFVGHGEFDADDPEESRFLLDDGRALRPRDLHGPIETTLQHDRPLVFFNSCQVAQQDFSLTRIGGWAARWVRECGCGAFVGPQWSVDDALASLFSQSFFAALDGGATFGQAAGIARLRVREAAPAQPSWLAYTIYAHPNGRLHLGRGLQPSSGDSLPNPLAEVPFPEEYVPSRRRRRPRRRRSLSWRLTLVGAVLILFAAVLYWRSGDIMKTAQSTQNSPRDPVEATRSGEDSIVSPPTIDIHSLQEPPYRLESVRLHLKSSKEIEFSLWRNWIETSAQQVLSKAGLELTQSKNAAWLVILEVSNRDPRQGATGLTCRILASFEIFHKGSSKDKVESDSFTGFGFTDEAACKAAIHKLAVRASSSVVSAYNDETSEE